LGPDTGSTGGSINGQSFSFTFKGNGIRQFLITPVGFDFGEVFVGNDLAAADVSVKNLANRPVVVSMAGGAAGVLRRSAELPGQHAHPGQSCQIFYAFTPAVAGHVTGSTGGSVNGQSFSFGFQGTRARRHHSTRDHAIRTAGDTRRQQRLVPHHSDRPAGPSPILRPRYPPPPDADQPLLVRTLRLPRVTLTCSATSGGGTSSQSVVIRHDATGHDHLPVAPNVRSRLGRLPDRCGHRWFLRTGFGDGDSGRFHGGPRAPTRCPSSATDIAGNTTTQSCSYVVGYAFSGFIQPGDKVVNGGSSIPVVFSPSTTQAGIRSPTLTPAPSPPAAR
jgi:hypothetical protein